MQPSSDQAIDKLNMFLRGEISAVETYRQALETVKTPTAREQLLTCERSHEHRVESIRQRIMQLGGKPSEEGGAWTLFAKAIEGSAKAMGEKAAITALEAGEDHGLNDYRKEIDSPDSSTRYFVQQELLPAQERTHGALSTLKHTFH